jgi:hypothetical protein
MKHWERAVEWLVILAQIHLYTGGIALCVIVILLALGIIKP